ncbi:MAG: hypothetical protein JRD93_22205 [Deltaproteobacteria bacterium]|nr:hypothetical protein [Deltaproteobacteria bacterium]
MKIHKCMCVLVCVAALMLLGGCAGFGGAPGGGGGKALPYGVSHGYLVGDITYPCFINSHTEIKLDTDDFDIIETVTAETSSINVLGLFSSGDNGYGKLFEKAREAGADDVINIKADTRTESVLRVFWKRATTKLTGTAIRWKKK